ncbi:PBECR3 domain-containing polyvalent protein [Akkermansia sp.]
MSIFSNNQIVEPGSEGISLPVFQPESGLQIPEVDAGIQESIDIQNDQEFTDRLNDFSRLPETHEFRPKLAERLSAYRQQAILDDYRDPALTADEKARRKKAAESLDLLRDWDTDEQARKRVEARWGKGFVERVRKASPEDRDEMLGMRLMVILGDGDGYKGHNEYNTRNSLWGQGVVTSAQVWRHFQASNKAAVDEEDNAIRSARAVEQQLPMIAEELWKGNSMLQVLDKMPELDAAAKVFLLTNCGYGSLFYRDVEDARQWAAKNGVQLTVSDDSVDQRATEMAKGYVEEMKRYGTWKNPFGLTMDDFRANAREEMAGKGISTEASYELGKKLSELKARNENAFNFVIGLCMSEIDKARNDGTAVLSPFARTFSQMMESTEDFAKEAARRGGGTGMPVYNGGLNTESTVAGRAWDGNRRFAEDHAVSASKFDYEVINQIRAIKQSVAESPDGASWWRRFGDGLGKMAAQTSFFLGTHGAGTFAALSNDRYEELRGQGVGGMESLMRGFAAGGTEVLVERLGGESLFKTLRLLGRKMPFADRFAGYMGGTTDMMRRGLYGNAALRYGVTSLAAGGSEWLEEVIQPTLQAPLDAGLARLFGSGNGMTVEDWKGQLEAAADPMLALQMVTFGAVAGGAQIPAFAREAQVSRVSAPQIMGLGVEPAEAERIANIVDPVEKNREIFQAALSMSDRAAQLESVRQGFSSMQEDYSWLARQDAYQAEVELLNLPRVEDLGDGRWRFTTTVRDAEGKDSYDVLELNEQDATARMQALLHDGIRLRMLEAQQAFAVDKTISQLEGSGKYVFEDMGRAETVETARKLAEAARLRITEGADVNAEAADLGTRMTYGQAARMDSTFEGRVQLGVERGEVASAKRARSHAYRVAMRNGQTLIRFHKGEVTVPELLEEVLETHLTEDMEHTKHSLDWYANNLRALQDTLQKEGYLGKGKDLIRKDVEVSVKDVIEGMSLLAKGDVLVRAADMRLPQWMKDFLQMVRQWVSSAKALLDLGTGLHEMERRRLAGESVPIDADFAQTVYALSNNLESYWMQEGARQGEAAVEQIVKEVDGSGVSLSLREGSSVTPEEMLDIQQRLKEWVSPESMEMARGKSRNEIFRLFGNELEPIAVIPDKYVRMFGSDVMDNRVYSGKGYFIDHAVNHHPEVFPHEYADIHRILSAPDEVALDDRTKGRSKFIFIKRLKRMGVVVVELGENDSGKLFLHKTFFNRKGKVYPNLKRLEIKESSSVDGPVTISQTSKEAPGRSLSALDDVFLIADSSRDVNDSSGEHDVSLSLSEDSPLTVSRGTQSLEVVHRIAADLRADAATWGRYAGKTDEAAFLVNVGRNVSLVKSALMHLPARYRVAVKPYIDRLQILAELAAKGRIDETRLVNIFARREIMREWRVESEEWREEAEEIAGIAARVAGKMTGRGPTQKFTREVFEDEMEKVRKAWAENRLHELMAEVMDKAAGRLEALARDGIAAGIARMLDQVLTIRKKKGKQQRGKVSMEAYTYLQEQVVPLLRMTAEEKEAAMNEAAAEMDRLEKEHPDQMDGEAVARMDELNEELTRLALYGNLEGMSVDEAEAAAKALEIYINTEKEGWAAVQEAAAERLNAIGRKIVERFNQTGKKADENSLRAANEKFHGKVSFKDFGDFMENMDQLLTRMGKMPALQEFTADMRSRLTNAFQQMRDARGLRAAAVQDLYERHLTERVMKARKVSNMAGWVTWFKTSHDTGVRLNGWVTQTAQLTLEQAREVRKMDARQRKEFIKKRWEEGQEYFSKETVDVLLTRLKEHEEATARAKAEGKRPRYRKYVTAKVSFQGEEGSSLVLSRDNALYLVLQSEQEDYREMMKQQGYTPEVVAALREYVGEEGMAIGYGLRELLKAQGDKIGKLYEQVTGVPFPRVENYFPARFWALDAMSDADAADMISGVPSTKGGNQGWQRVRTKHHRRLDTSVGALSVFWEATDITDHWYYTQDVTADFRGLLRRREVAESLVANLGKDDFVRLRRWVDLLERAGVVQGQAVGSLDKLLNAVYSGQAKAILAFRFETLMKQGSAVLNAWIGDPSIGFLDYLGTMAKLRNGSAEMGVIKMLKSPEFQARLNDRVDVERLSRLRDDSSYTLAEAALVWGMSGIEFTDVFFNAVGSAALWNIKFRQAVKAGVEEGRARDEAWQAVRDALHSAQPQSWIDKSFGGLHRGAFGRAIFYMMSENYNKTAAIYGLARAGFAPGVTRQQRWASLSKAGKVWLAYGAFNAIIGAMLDYMKDDEDEWEKRGWQGYLYAALAGPFAGMPLVGEAVEWMFSELLGAKVYTGSAGRALIDFRSGWNAAWKLGEMMQEGGHEAGDYMKQVIRLGRVFGAAGGVASGMANKGIQAVGQYMTLGAALMNPVKTVADVAD